MASLFPRTKISAVFLSVLLAACGGGGSDGSNGVQATSGSADAKLAPVANDFYGVLRTASPDGSTVSGIVRLDVWGGGLANVELLPESGYTPKYGRFNITESNSQALLDFDTTKLPNGPIKVRIVAFNAPAGQPANEAVIMATRTWNINNTVTPGPLSVTSVSAPSNGTVMSGTRRLEVRGTGLTNVELLPASGYSPKLGVFNVNAERTYAWLDLDTRTQPDGMQNVRISAFSTTAGQPNAKEIVAMPARQWNFQNGLAGFTANLVQGPVHGSIVGGDYLYFIVKGTGLENVEVLPSTGYTPKYAIAEITEGKTTARVGVDLRTVPKGPLTLRISAFNKLAGQSGAQEIVAMPPRTFDVR